MEDDLVGPRRRIGQTLREIARRKISAKMARPTGSNRCYNRVPRSCDAIRTWRVFHGLAKNP